MDVLAELFVILVLVRACGEVTERIGQTASLGEIIAGMIVAGAASWLAPTVPFLSNLASSQSLEIVANLGIFSLVLVAGIEMEPSKVVQSSAASLAVAVGGVLVPLSGGVALGWIFLPDTDLKTAQALLIGVALSISAIPATVKVLNDFDLLHTKIGEVIVSAAVFDDILGLFLLAVLLAMVESGQAPDLMSMFLLLGKVAAFFAVTMALGAHVYPRVQKGIRAMQIAAIDLSALTIVSLAYGWLAMALGMHWILGAFMAGLYFEQSRVGARAYNEVKLICGAITSGILGPLFFAYIGARVDLSAIYHVPGFLCLLILVAFAGKVIGAGLPALCFGLGRREALSVGVGMSARGAVELVILSIVYEAGLFAVSGVQGSIVPHLYSALIIMAVITTLMAPLFLPYALPGTKKLRHR